MSGISKRSNRAIAVETETMNKEAGVVSLMEAAPEEPEDFEADTEEKAHHEYDEKKQTKDPPAAQFEHPKSIKATTPNVMFHLPPEDPTQPLPARQLINQAKAASTQALYGNENDIIAEVKEGEEGEELPSSILFSGDPYGGTTNSIRTETSFMTPLPHRENIIDLDVLKDQVFFVFPDWRRRLSKFSLLIVLSSIIATCGIIADSTATVIGAMIVAPLMTPILGTMLAIVLTDYCNFLVSLVIVFLGVLCAVFMGFLFSLVFNDDVLDPDNNSQIAARISPRLLDMVAALATGAVGSIALVRNDIAGSLPGVSIAISLVPPLCVAGVCIKLKNWDGMLGAFLLFLTNFSCIVGVGVCVMFGYRVHRMAKRRRMHIARLAASMYQNISIMFVIALLVAVGAMLYYSTRKHQESYEIQACLMQDGLWQYPEPQSAGVDTTWDVTDVNVKVSKSFSFKNITRHAMVTFKGIPPFPAILNLDEVAEECGVDAMELQFIPSYRVEFA